MPKQAPKHPNPEQIDDDNPEWTDADFVRARPAAEVLPALFGTKTAQSMLKPRGRPPADTVKERITIRFDADVLAAFRATGKGWQTRVNDAMRDWLRTHHSV
ncbi:MAG: BrnA antitoxin family protein [Rhodoferax sp.]|nr:BrnA antitoxin family protein [Rhodoferax sp.]